MLDAGLLLVNSTGCGRKGRDQQINQGNYLQSGFTFLLSAAYGSFSHAQLILPYMFPTLTVLFFWKLILRNQIVRNRKGVLKLKSQPFPLHSGLFLQTCMLCTRYFPGVLWDSSPETPLSLRGLSGLSRCSPEQQERVDKSLLQNVSNVFWLIIWIHLKWLRTIKIIDSPAIHVTCLKRVLRCVSLLPLDRYKGPGNLLDNTILAPLALIHSSSNHSASKFNWWI